MFLSLSLGSYLDLSLGNCKAPRPAVDRPTVVHIWLCINQASQWQKYLLNCKEQFFFLALDTTERLHFQFSLSRIGEGHGNPLRCSCLENPRDGGAWWAAVYGVAQSRTRLEWLSSSSNISSQKVAFLSQSCKGSRWPATHFCMCRNLWTMPICHFL